MIIIVLFAWKEDFFFFLFQINLLNHIQSVISYCFGDIRFSGFFAGCAVALILAIILIVRTRHLLEYKEEGDKYMENMFPLYR